MRNTRSQLTTSTAPASPPVREQRLLVTRPNRLPKPSQAPFAQKPNPYRASRKRRRSEEERPIDRPAKQPKWSTAEDAKVIELYESGEAWKSIADKLPGRTANACKFHYLNYLKDKTDKEKRPGSDERPIGRPAKHLNWSRPERLKVVKLRESGKEWKYIADQLPGRTALACKRYYSRRLVNKTDEMRARLPSVYQRCGFKSLSTMVTR